MGEALDEEFQRSLEDPHRIAELLSLLKKIIQDQKQKANNAVDELARYRNTHSGKIKKLEEENHALKKEIQDEKKKNEKERAEKGQIRTEASEEKRTLTVQMEALQKDIRKYEEQLSSLQMVKQESCSRPKAPGRLIREKSKPRCEVDEYTLKEALMSKNETLTGEVKDLRAKCDKLAGEHAELVAKHTALEAKYNEVASKHCEHGSLVRDLAGGQKVLDKRVRQLEREQTKRDIHEEVVLTGNSTKREVHKNEQRVFSGRGQSRPSTKQKRPPLPPPVNKLKYNQYAVIRQRHGSTSMFFPLSSHNLH